MLEILETLAKNMLTITKFPFDVLRGLKNLDIERFAHLYDQEFLERIPKLARSAISRKQLDADFAVIKSAEYYQKVLDILQMPSSTNLSLLQEDLESPNESSDQKSCSQILQSYFSKFFLKKKLYKNIIGMKDVQKEENDFIIVNLTFGYILVIEAKSTLNSKSIEKAVKLLKHVCQNCTNRIY